MGGIVAIVYIYSATGDAGQFLVKCVTVKCHIFRFYHGGENVTKKGSDLHYRPYLLPVVLYLNYGPLEYLNFFAMCILDF
jgi:hypothetical protein